MPGNSGGDGHEDGKGDENGDRAGLGVLRPVGVLTDPVGRDDPPTVTDGPPTVTGDLRLGRDVRVLDPAPTVGDVTFAGRLGRRVANRQRGVALTVVRRTLDATATEQVGADAGLLGEGDSFPELTATDSTTVDEQPPESRERVAADRPDRLRESRTPIATDRPSRVFATPRSRDTGSRSQSAGTDSQAARTSDWPPTTTGTSHAGPSAAESGGGRPGDADPGDETVSSPATDRARRSDDPSRDADRSRSEDWPWDRPRTPADGPGASERPSPLGDSRTSRPSAHRGVRQPAETPTSYPSGDADPSRRSRRPGSGSAVQDDGPGRVPGPVTRAERDADAFTRRLDRLTAGPAADTPVGSTPPTGRSDTSAGMTGQSGDDRAATTPRSGGERAVAPSGQAATERTTSVTGDSADAAQAGGRDDRSRAGRSTERGSAGVPGSGERVASLHDVSVLRSTRPDRIQRAAAADADVTLDASARSDASARPVTTSSNVGVTDPPAGSIPSRAREPGVDRRGQWNPTFRRRPSTADAESDERATTVEGQAPRSTPDSPTASGTDDGTPAETTGGRSTASTSPGDPGVGRRVGWNPTRWRTAPAGRPQRPSGEPGQPTRQSPGPVRTVVERSRGVERTDRPAPARDQQSVPADEGRPSGVPDESGTGSAASGAEPTTSEEPATPAEPTTSEESADVTSTATPTGTDAAERGGPVEASASGPAAETGSTGDEAASASDDGTPARDETVSTRGAFPDTLGRTVGWRPPRRVRDAAPRAPERPRRLPDRTVARRTATHPTEGAPAVEPLGDSRVEPGSRPEQRQPSRPRTDQNRTTAGTGRTQPEIRTGADATRRRVRSRPPDATPPESVSTDAAAAETPPADVTPAETTAAAASPAEVRPETPPPARTAPDREDAPGHERRGSVAGVGSPEGVRGDSPVWHAPARRGGTPSGSAADTGSAASVRDPRVAVSASETPGQAETAASSTARGRSGAGARRGGIGARPTGARSSARRPLTHRIRRRPTRDEPTEATGAESQSGGSPGTSGGPRPGGVSPGDTTVSGGGRPQPDAGPDGTPGPVTFPADGRPGADGVGSRQLRPDADVPAGSRTDTGTASPPPVKRSGRDTQVGTTRIGSLTEMPTLTHQTGRIAGTGRAGSASAPDAAGDAPPTDAWPETATSAGPVDAAGSSAERDAGTAGRDARRAGPGSQRSGAGRRLAARARSKQPRGPGPGPNSGPGGSAGYAGSPGQAGSAGPGDAGLDPFPDLDIKQPAPRVDATRRDAESGPRYETRPDDGESGRRGGRDRRRGTDRDADDVGRAVEEAFFGQGPDLSAHSTEVDRVVDRLYREIERKMRIERERRGL